MSDKKPLNILVIGPTGHGGSYLVIELCERGHNVTGLSRKPETIGTHPKYTPKPFDVVNSSFTELHQALSGYDVVINEFSPHSEGHAALVYMPFIEVTRKIVLAAHVAKVPYFIMVGGTGSLYVPGQDHLCAGEHGHFWRAFRQSIADSESHVQYMEHRLPPLGHNLRKLRTLREKVRSGLADEEDIKWMREYHESTFRDYSQTFVKAARVTWMFFDGNRDHEWSYASPPARYRPCKGGEEYVLGYDFLPLKGSPKEGEWLGWDKGDDLDLEGRLEGISTVDFARALVDDAETRRGKWKHWTAWTKLDDDTPFPSYAKFDSK